MGDIIAAAQRKADLIPQPKDGILRIAAYKPGKSSSEGAVSPIKLSSNENMLGCSPAARVAFLTIGDELQTYPDGRAPLLRSAIAEHFGLEEDRLVFGSGSDELFAILNQVMLAPGDNIVQGQYGFNAFSIGARACQAEVRYAPERNFRIDIAALAAQVDELTRIVFLANPGNPTGTYITGDEVRALHEAIPRNVVLVLDGAYAEFVDDPAYDEGIGMARAFDNVIVTRTFSKLHGLAGLRVGWAYGPTHLIDAMDRVRLPFNVNAAAQAAAVAALDDIVFQKASLGLIAEWRPWVASQLTAIGLEVIPSMTNFLLVGFPETAGRSARDGEALLAANGLLVRPVGVYGLANHLRITIGLEEHNRALVQVLKELMA